MILCDNLPAVKPDYSGRSFREEPIHPPISIYFASHSQMVLDDFLENSVLIAAVKI